MDVYKNLSVMNLNQLHEEYNETDNTIKKITIKQIMKEKQNKMQQEYKRKLVKHKMREQELERMRKQEIEARRILHENKRREKKKYEKKLEKKSKKEKDDFYEFTEDDFLDAEIDNQDNKDTDQFNDITDVQMKTEVDKDHVNNNLMSRMNSEMTMRRDKKKQAFLTPFVTSDKNELYDTYYNPDDLKSFKIT